MVPISTSGRVLTLLAGLAANEALNDDVRRMCREALQVVIDLEWELARIDTLTEQLAQAATMAGRLTTSTAREVAEVAELRAVLTRHTRHLAGQ